MSEVPHEENIHKEKRNPTDGFLGDLTDGRKKGDWKTRYDLDAQKEIRWERNYLIFFLSCALLIPLAIGLSLKFAHLPYPLLNLQRYIYAFWGGELGGLIFAMKWLVHSIAKDTWNMDRRMWRTFTPHLSACLAFVVILLVNCEVFKLTDPKGMSIHKCYGIGFLVGYFSDNAIGKLTELAQVFFGSSLTRK
jgi:hypothetical protein